MIGAIIGDIVGSPYEGWSCHNIKMKEFAFFTPSCTPTDDSFMTLALAKAITNCKGIILSWNLKQYVVCSSMDEHLQTQSMVVCFIGGATQTIQRPILAMGMVLQCG